MTAKLYCYSYRNRVSELHSLTNPPSSQEEKRLSLIVAEANKTVKENS